MPTEIERLYREHRAGLVRLVERELRDRHDAEDVVQTAFLDAQRALERGTIPGNPRAWLATIALNAARRLRRRRVNAELLEEYAVQEASRLPEIRAALASLPREQRAAVLYRDVLGLSYGETAEQMETSVNAVTMLLYRGRQRLRQTLGLAAGGFGLWRWLKQAGVRQAAAVKGAAVVAVAAGLATGGIVTARVVAPAAAGTSAVPQTHAVGRTPRAARTPGHTAALGPVSRHSATRGRSSTAKARSMPTQGSQQAAPSSTTAGSTAAAPSTTGLRLPTVSLPNVTIPAVPTTVAVTTPVATATVTVPLSTTVTVTTPLTTVTVPIP